MLESQTKQQLIDQLHSVFGNVTREGGVSWREAWAIDYRESDAGCAAARAKDKDQSWIEVAENPEWHVNSWGSPWVFLDCIGHRYYLAAAIARDLIFDKEVLNADFFNGSFACLLPDENAFIANYVLYKAELPTRNALTDVLDEADITYDQHLKCEESGWTPEPVWSAWQEPLNFWRQYLPSNH